MINVANEKKRVLNNAIKERNMKSRRILDSVSCSLALFSRSLMLFHFFALFHKSPLLNLLLFRFNIYIFKCKTFKVRTLLLKESMHRMRALFGGGRGSGGGKRFLLPRFHRFASKFYDGFRGLYCFLFKYCTIFSWICRFVYLLTVNFFLLNQKHFYAFTSFSIKYFRLFVLFVCVYVCVFLSLFDFSMLKPKVFLYTITNTQSSYRLAIFSLPNWVSGRSGWRRRREEGKEEWGGDGVENGQKHPIKNAMSRIF